LNYNTNIYPNISYGTSNLSELGFEIDHSGNKIICNKMLNLMKMLKLIKMLNLMLDLTYYQKDP
jgi:hypothetical protein